MVPRMWHITLKALFHMTITVKCSYQKETFPLLPDLLRPGTEHNQMDAIEVLGPLCHFLVVSLSLRSKTSKPTNSKPMWMGSVDSQSGSLGNTASKNHSQKLPESRVFYLLEIVRNGYFFRAHSPILREAAYTSPPSHLKASTSAFLCPLGRQLPDGKAVTVLENVAKRKQ